MNNETEQIFSSTGSLGVTRRQYDRIYINPERFSSEPQETETLTRLAGVVDRNPESVTRGVFRGSVSGSVLSEIRQNGLGERLEVALPLQEFLGDDNDSFLIYWSHNSADRSAIVPRETMIAETTDYREAALTGLDRIRQVQQRGYTFASTIDEEHVDQVYELWSETFGWERYQVENLKHRLEQTAHQDPHERDLWFSAIQDNGTVISVSMAERLTIPVQDGTLDLIESTEWRTRDEYAGQSLMTANLTMLSAQVISDIRSNGGRLPLLFAECNFQSRSDRAGHGAGFTIPSRELAPQLIIQNVDVGDGQIVPDGKLRDFSFMYLPTTVIAEHYDQVQTDAMMRSLNGYSR